MIKKYSQTKNICPNRYAKHCGRGYTIIETMIAISLFLVITVVGIGSLLSANSISQKSQNTRQILDNLSFILEDMSRNLRTGYNYRCVSGAFSAANISTPQSCPSGGAIAFENDIGNPDNNNDQWVYKIESRDSGATYNIYKSVTGGATDSDFVQLNPEEVRLDVTSGFTVTGAEPPSAGDSLQPFVTIKLVGIIKNKDSDTPFALQTSVSQRVIDI